MKTKATAKIAELALKVWFCGLGVLCGCLFVVSPVRAQNVSRSPIATRVAILQAEERGAPTARDLAIIRAGLRSGDGQTTRVAVRALGRLERPALVPDIIPSLRHPLPEIRSEAANAVAQALYLARGEPDAEQKGAVRDSNRAAAVNALIARFGVEADANVRGAIAEALGRVPATTDEVQRVEETLVGAATHATNVAVRLGIARGLEVLGRLHKADRPLSDEAIELLRTMVPVALSAAGLPIDPARDVRVRRIALEALVTAQAVDDRTLARAMNDPDPQVRRLAVLAIGSRSGADDWLMRGFTDPAAMVRIEALRALRARDRESLCAASVLATGDSDTHTVLIALDQLATCGESADAMAILEQAVTDLSAAAAPRGWHRAAHAIVALAGAAPKQASAALQTFTGSRIWQLRMYSARAAAVLKDRAALERLAADDDDNVREAAVDGLSRTFGHDADRVYVDELSRSGYQIVRAAANALTGTTAAAAVPALKAALQRLTGEGRDNSYDARVAIEKALASAGASSPAARVSKRPRAAARDLNAEDLRRLAAPRARLTIRGVGQIELLLFTAEAPATVLHFAKLAQAGYYNGLTFHRVVPNFVAQGGSPGANEYIGDAMFMPDEVGTWPHVRGAVGTSTRGRHTGDAQFFIDLVDNPRFNHEYTVFAQVLNGIDVVDQILEGDVIDRIDILPR